MILSYRPDSLTKIPGSVQRFFTQGNRVTPLFGADCDTPAERDVWNVTLGLLENAKATVQVEMYNIDQPRIVDLLARRARDGVKVQVIVDPPTEERDAPRKAAIETMQAAGVEVLCYPLPPPEEGGFRSLEHVKMLLVDGRRAVVGGINWGEHSPMNHDYDVLVEGPAVGRMGWLFRDDWQAVGGAPLPPPQRPPVCGDDAINLIITGDDPHERTIAKTVLRAIRSARRSIHVEMFALTEPRTIDALVEAHQRGVDVKVILHPMEIGDDRLNERACRELRQAGVNVRWYTCNPDTQQKLHAKLGLFDDDQVIVGSANWSTMGFNTNREADLEILSLETAAAFEAQFALDWKTRSADAPTYIQSRKGTRQEQSNMTVGGSPI